MIDPKQFKKMLGPMKKQLKEAHLKLMQQVPPEERAKVQAQINSMVDNAKQEHNHPFMNDFMKEIYGR